MKWIKQANVVVSGKLEFDLSMSDVENAIDTMDIQYPIYTGFSFSFFMWDAAGVYVTGVSQVHSVILSGFIVLTYSHPYLAENSHKA